MATALQDQLDLQQLIEADFTNDEILALVSFFCSQEIPSAYEQHIGILRDKWSSSDEFDTLDLIVLSKRELFPVNILRVYYGLTKDQGYESLIFPLIIFYQADPSANVYVRRLEEAFGYEPDEEFTRDIVDWLSGENSSRQGVEGIGILHIIDYYEQHLKQISAFAPIPDWFVEVDIDAETLPKLEQKKFREMGMDTRKAAEFLVDQLSFTNIEIPSDTDFTDVEQVEAILRGKDPKDIEELLSTIKINPDDVERLRKRVDIFRVWGPVNPSAGDDYSEIFLSNGEENMDVIYGGPRMFLNNWFEDENDEDSGDWFVGYCQNCLRRIRSYHHAVRVPFYSGGWKGCYDSWECARASVRLDWGPLTRTINIDGEERVDDEDIKVSLENQTIMELTLSMIDEFEALINKYGIMDRYWEGAEEIEENKEIVANTEQMFKELGLI